MPPWSSLAQHGFDMKFDTLNIIVERMRLASPLGNARYKSRFRFEFLLH
jgi:hypothetical protein